MKKITGIIVITFLLTLLAAFPASAASENSDVFFGYLDDFVQTDAFGIQDAVSAQDLAGLPTENAVSRILVFPAKWSKGWMDKNPGSWLKAKVVWKTTRGVDNYFFEVYYDGSEYSITKSDSMFSHEKEVYRDIP